MDSVKTNRGVVLQKKDVQKTKPKKEDGAAKEDSRENEEKPDRNVPAEETESKQPKIRV